MATQRKYCPHCGAEVGIHEYTHAAVCYRCDKVFGLEEATDTPAPGTDRRRARRARFMEIAGGILAVGTGILALFIWMFV